MYIIVPLAERVNWVRNPAKQFEGSSLYQKDIFQVVEGKRVTYAKWIQLEDLFIGKKLFHPENLINFL